VPAARDTLAIFGREHREIMRGDHGIEYLAMHIVDVEAGIDAAKHPLQRASTIVIGYLVPISVNAVAPARLDKCPNDPRMPIENGAAGIEGKCLDPLHEAPSAC
jgi:hypothetical protein